MNALASDPRRLFWGAIAATIALRFVLAWWLPLTGDEAFFVYWGEAPALGVYDHPPMVGWFLAALLQVGHSPVWLRLPAILAPALIAIAMRAIVTELARGRPDAQALGDWAALAWLLAPVQVLNVLVTTDTPLVLFSFASIAAYALAVRRRSFALCAVAGIALGLAFLSKYFAVLVGLAYVVYVAAIRREARAWRELAVVVACAVPFGLVNLAWNYEHCWANLMFNVYNRHNEAGFAWYRPLLFLALLVYVAGPLLLFDLARARSRLRESIRDPAVALLAACAAVPIAVFFVLSAVKSIGLHWLFAFMPPLFMAGAFVLGPARLAASAKFLAAFSAAHLAGGRGRRGAPARDVSALAPLRQPGDGVPPGRGARRAEALRRAVRLRREQLLGGGAAVVPRRGAGVRGAARRADGAEPWRTHYFPTFGPGSAHGRHDDILTDFRQLDGKDILVVRKTAAEPDEYRPYFRAIEMREIAVRGARYFLVLGQGFDYAAYRDRVLAEVRDRYYRIPRYLPQGRCYLCERYWATATCPAP